MSQRINSNDIFGAEIQYFRTDPSDWDTLLRRFKDTGLRCVTTYTPWSTHLIAPPDAKHPAGHLDFEGKTDPRRNLLAFLDLVARHDLFLNFRSGPFCCNEMIHGGYPGWLVMSDPSIMVWDWQNRTTQGYWIGAREGSQPSYLHPAYLQLCKHWLASVDEIIRPRLQSAGGFITMVNLDNEISYIVKDSFLDSDYNPVNIHPGGFYHQFLTEKYVDVNRLNDAYGSKHESIQHLAPPRRVPESIGRDFAWYSDWVEFKTWVMCRYIEQLRGMHESNGVVDVTFMTNFNPHRPEGVPTRMPAFERAVTGKAGRGIVGYDFYRGAFMSYSGYHSMARVLKLMNASLKYTWSAEFMSGLWNLDMSKNSRISDDHMRFMARCALAHGCKALAWFMFHDRDCWGDSPVSQMGHKRPSYDVLCETPKLVFQKIKSWDSLVPQTDVAIIYDLIQHVHTSIGDPAPCADNDLHVGAPAVAGVAAGIASREYEGLYRLVEQAGHQAAAVDVMHDLSQHVSRLPKFKIAFVPGSPVIEKSASDALRIYVQGGGVLVVSGAWPEFDETGRAIAFLGVGSPAPEQQLGEGKILHWPAIAQTEPERDDPAAIARVRELIAALVGSPQIAVELINGPVTWTDWKEGGGQTLYTQPRLLLSATLQKSEDELIACVMNHYIVPVKLRIKIAGVSEGTLIDLDDGTEFPVRNGSASLSIDRKSAILLHLSKK
jgi:beta-galactosidase